MVKILFNILTCNRFYYFKNCIESIIECVDMDRIDILICDNCTIEKGFDEYVQFLCLKHKNITMKKFQDRTRNELYRAMNWAIEYAQKNEYDIIDFIQDDIQYLYRYDDHIDDVISIFDKYKKVVQINCNLAWRRKVKRTGKLQNIEVNGHNHTILLDKRACDNGFTRVKVYDKVGPYPMQAVSWGLGENRYKGKINGEIWFGKRCQKKGYKRAYAYMSNSGMIFDCAYVRGEYRYGRYFPPIGKYYLKLLHDKHIDKIRKNAKRNLFSYIEELCIPDRWKPTTMGKHCLVDIKNKITSD